jgi:prepilin-type N-terminal cleavage/methylation domain-containing protein
MNYREHLMVILLLREQYLLCFYLFARLSLFWGLALPRVHQRLKYMQKRSAFTLIELLVVIAIIAILAAILFPVFAQAKIAAKGAASLSNTKQSTLSLIMYQGDYDDTFAPSVAWNTGSDPICFSTGMCCSPWTWLVQPYMKSGDLVNDPLAPAQYSNPGAQVIQDAYTPTYGYNHTALSPWYSDGGGAPAHTHSISATAPDSPANLVMLTSKFSDSEATWGSAGEAVGFQFMPNADNGPLYNVVVDAPNCFTIAAACIGNWGVPDGADNQWNMFTGGLNAIVAGVNTGGNSRRKTDNIATSFTDGHAKYMKPGALAVGTNWSDQLQEGTLTVSDKTAYMWYVHSGDGG